MVRQPPQAVFASYLIRGRPLARDLSEWLHHFVQSLSYRRQALELSAGIGRANINAKSIGDIELPIAPLPEQHRIVEAIDSYLTRLDDAVASLERVQRNLERYRASVLKAAVEGRLVPTEAEPFRRDNWKRLGDALVSLDQGWSPRCEREASVDPAEWGVIKTTAVQPRRYLETANKRLPAPLEPRPHLELRPGDLLVTRAGPRKRVGVCSLVRSTRPKLMLCDKVYRLRCNPDVATPGYLELLLNAPPIVDDMNELKTGISDSGVNLTQKRFKELRLPLPSITVQERIEEEVARAWSIADSVEVSSSSACSRSQALRQSILKWAFEGKLVEQDPNDESASTLLQRIRVERSEALR